MTIKPATRVLGPDNATLLVHTGRTGAAAKAGHDLVIEVTSWTATLELTGDPVRDSIVLEADPTSLRVREGNGGIQPLTDEDREKIRKTIDSDVLKRRAVSFRSTAVDRSAGGAHVKVRGELELAGKSAPIAFELLVGDDGTLNGRVVVNQSDWGLKPYSTLFGALKVRDAVEVAIDAGLPVS